MIYADLKLSVLLNSNHAAAEERASLTGVVRVIPQRECLFILPFDAFFCEDKNDHHNEYTLYGQAFSVPDIPVYCRPVIPDVLASIRLNCPTGAGNFP